MRKSLLLGVAFFLTTSAFAMSIPAGRHLLGDDARVATSRDGFVLASEHGERKHGEHRRYAEEDDDHDDDEGGATAQPRPADPNAPVPDNGLFTGKSRPQVEVQ